MGRQRQCKRLGSPHRPPAPPTRASRARRTRDGDDTRRPGAMEAPTALTRFGGPHGTPTRWGGDPPGPNGRGGLLRLGFSGCSQVGDPALRPCGRPPRRARRLERRRRALERWCARVRGYDQATGPGPQRRRRRRGGPTGYCGDLPRLVAGRLRSSGRRKVPPSAQGCGGMIYPRIPPPTATSLAPVQGATAPMRDAPSPSHLRRRGLRSAAGGQALPLTPTPPPSGPHRGER